MAWGFVAWLSRWMVGLVSEMTFEESRFEGELRESSLGQVQCEKLEGHMDEIAASGQLTLASLLKRSLWFLTAGLSALSTRSSAQPSPRLSSPTRLS